MLSPLIFGPHRIPYADPEIITQEVVTHVHTSGEPGVRIHEVRAEVPVAGIGIDKAREIAFGLVECFKRRTV